MSCDHTRFFLGVDRLASEGYFGPQCLRPFTSCRGEAAQSGLPISPLRCDTLRVRGCRFGQATEPSIESIARSVLPCTPDGGPITGFISGPGEVCCPCRTPSLVALFFISRPTQPESRNKSPTQTTSVRKPITLPLSNQANCQLGQQMTRLDRGPKNKETGLKISIT